MEEEVKLRVDKAIEIKTALKKMHISSMKCFESFHLLLNKWVKKGEHVSGFIYIEFLNKYLIYELDEPELTVVKISSMT
jgi:hypothetical protein